jgi:hypothetical protein
MEPRTLEWGPSAPATLVRTELAVRAGKTVGQQLGRGSTVGVGGSSRLCAGRASAGLDAAGTGWAELTVAPARRLTRDGSRQSRASWVSRSTGCCLAAPPAAHYPGDDQLRRRRVTGSLSTAH